ncbi:MAG: adenylyltransferase/cytidyltransferase family protein [Candidatus Paceibacterota bacterium]
MADKEKKIQDILNKESSLDSRFISDHKELKEVVDFFRKGNKRIVLTQGVYDLIHEGHAMYLERAKSYGDILIVGVDSDELTKKRKGPDRPIVPQEERLKMLVHLRSVDVVTLKDIDQDIGDLIRLIRPEVLVTSESTSDFTQNLKKEYEEFCEKIVTIPPTAATSTTARIRNLTIEGANKLSKEIEQITKNFIKKIKGDS